MFAPEMAQPTEVSVRQFVNDSGAVTRGLREGRRYVLTINGEPLAEVTPIRRHRFVRTSQAQAMFATAPTLDYAELCHDLDTAIADELSDDPLEGTGL
jgi:antitoxin (DNA-binding transcriptional repressor) of toxin-antitoxin stability system